MEKTVSEYQIFHQQLVANLVKQVEQLLPFITTEDHAPSQDDLNFIQHFHSLCADLNASEQGYPLGQWIITTIIARYPHITPLVPRDLFWFFGGDCLHYLGEDEIARFQQLDEAFHTQDAETDTLATYSELRNEIFGIN